MRFSTSIFPFSGCSADNQWQRKRKQRPIVETDDQVPIKVEDDTNSNESITPCDESLTITFSPTKRDSIRSHSLSLSTSKTAYERITFLEQNVGIKDTSSTLRRRIEHLETQLLGETSSDGYSIIQRIKTLENEFF